MVKISSRIWYVKVKWMLKLKSVTEKDLTIDIPIYFL